MKKKKLIPCIIAIVAIVLLGIAGVKLYQLMFGGAVKVQTADIISAIAQMKLQLIIGAVILIAGIVILIIGLRKKDENLKDLLKVQGIVAMVLAVVITVNTVCFGPQYSNLSTVLSGTTAISEEHINESLEAAEAIADEGITLLKNEGNALPLASGTKLNVFGWSSVAPVYGGAGSGSSDSSKAASLLDGLHEAGFETNTELENFYTNFRSERPSISFFGVDFTIPEPTMEEYQNANIFENAKAFSDTALVVIGRSSGEGSDLAMNLSDDNNFTIGENGEQLGIMSAREAMKLAEEAELDLVKIAPTAKPPVCKIIDYGKYRYELARKEKEARKKQKVVEIKEIRLSPNIDSNDLNTKMNAAKKFLSKGDKVKITLRFRGREMAHMNASKHILDDFAASLGEIAVVEKAPKVEGRSISMVLAEKKS